MCRPFDVEILPMREDTTIFLKEQRAGFLEEEGDEKEPRKKVRISDRYGNRKSKVLLSVLTGEI